MWGSGKASLNHEKELAMCRIEACSRWREEKVQRPWGEDKRWEWGRYQEAGRTCVCWR